MDNICIIHCTLQDVYNLECVHAKLTKDGWIIPQWLINMRTFLENNQ